METILCIPRMDVRTSSKYIFQSLCKLNWGKISILNEIPLRNDPTQKRILIKVKWNPEIETEIETETETKTKTKTKLDNGDIINLVHDINSPWFWKIMLSRPPPHS